MASLASVYSSHLSRLARSVGESFHCLTGSTERDSNLARCSAWLTENHSLMQVDARVDEHPLELRARAHELEVLLRGAEAHHPLDAGAVVPGAVEQHDLTRAGQVGDVALEVPLGLLHVGGHRQCDDPGAAGVEVLHEPLDRAALAGGVAALEDDGHLLAGVLDPDLQLEQLDLQVALDPLVLAAAYLDVVRVALAPRRKGLVGRLTQGLLDQLLAKSLPARPAHACGRRRSRRRRDLLPCSAASHTPVNVRGRILRRTRAGPGCRAPGP